MTGGTPDSDNRMSIVAERAVALAPIYSVEWRVEIAEEGSGTETQRLSEMPADGRTMSCAKVQRDQKSELPQGVQGKVYST